MKANKSSESMKNLAASQDVNLTTLSSTSADDSITSNAATPITASKLEEGDNKKGNKTLFFLGY
jgi:hypothetical protein